MAALPALKNFSSFLQNNQVTFTNGLLILFTLGGEQIFRFTAFKCPCTQSKAFVYACSFVIGPAVVLCILGMVVNNLTWRLCHGCWYRSVEYKHSKREKCEHFIAVLARACIVPSAWIFITLLDGSYYACMLAKEPCVKDSIENQSLMATSQIISWIYLACLVGIASFGIFISRCIDTVTYVQNKYVMIYREVEGTVLEESMKEAANVLAKDIVKEFMGHKKIEKKDWDSISKAPAHRIKLEQASSYTPLEEWRLINHPVVKEKNGNQNQGVEDTV